MSTRYVAFFSYTRADDDHDDGLLTAIRERLEGELRLTLGRRDVEIFQDRDDIEPGDAWEARLQKAIDEAVFLIPVITPSFFASEFCRKEFERFWEKAQADAHSARIIPIYWREHFPLEGMVPAAGDEILAAVKALQYDDWRDVRHAGIASPAMRRKIEATARQVGTRYLARVTNIATGEPISGVLDATAAQVEASPGPSRDRAAADWALVEGSVDPRDFRAFIEVHESGFLVQRARHRLSDLAEAEWSETIRASRSPERSVGDNRAVVRFLRQYPNSEYDAEAKALLDRINGEARKAAEEEQYRAEGRIRIEDAGWFLPGAGKSEWFKDHDSGPEMVVVPAGSFMMGSPPDEERWDGYDGSEEPQHTVTISAPFAVGRFAITFDEWDAARTAGGVAHTPEDEDWGRGVQPVIDVSWFDAVEYCRWLTEATGKEYRLLTEAEWEYVCRAGTTTAFWWGNEIAAEQANYDGNFTYGSGRTGEYRQRTLPVESFAPNPWGLFQVHGNVWEWVADDWHENYKGAPGDGAMWSGGDTSLRVVRGGSWGSLPQFLRSAYRNWVRPGNRKFIVGFRVARTLTP